ncbi:MAG TPA: prenyltransferase/squalene oxidase repeat-containing protein [Chthonomonadaceae bacterium]|nr:prenyltransferase/squalene oxidase repeat-containing protein [Chthonomonadaceae bacterium]
MNKVLTAVVLLLSASPFSGARAAGAAKHAEIQRAVDRSAALLAQSIAEYPKHNTCFSCHHHGVPALALSLARSHGLFTDGADGKSVAAAADTIEQQTAKDLRGDLENYRKGAGQPGGVTRAGYALLALQACGTKADDVTAAVVGFLLQKNEDKGFWPAGSNRPPAEASPFTNTLLAIRALRAYGALADKPAIDSRIERARQWLEQAEPKETEDRVFQLWALSEAGASPTVLDKWTKALVAEQRPDGGWAQLPGAATDCYATATVVAMLRICGLAPGTDPALQRGVAYLLHAQEADGSWHVVSRSKPVQPYFESGFPHGRDQFISAATTAWAICALTLCDPAVPAK